MSLRVLGVTAAAVIALSVVSRTDSSRIAFLSVTDEKNRPADERLVELLQAKTGAVLDPHSSKTYSSLIHDVAQWTDAKGPFIARMTPYPFVAASMLGAHFEVLATYKSQSTGDMTYRSYFVVNRARWADWSQQSAGAPRPPTLDNLRDYLKTRRGRNPKFIYHDEFSTSSYFLPALWLRSQLLFDMSTPSQALSPLDVEQPPTGSYELAVGALDKITVTGSTALVHKVAAGNADIAAVWDGTKKDFDPKGRYAEFGEKVWFIPLPDELPNDLLVC